MLYYIVSVLVKGRGCEFFEWIHEGIGSSLSNMQTPAVDALQTRITETIVRHILEMELHALNRVLEFCHDLSERLKKMTY